MDEVKSKISSEFVTVVSVGAQNEPEKPDDKNGYVTVLTIGNGNQTEQQEQIEEVLVYRLPGERLGFGLKFEGGTKACEFVKRLFIQSCAPDSPASRVRSSWGCLTEGDEVLEIDSVSIKSMTRIDCVRCLKDSNVVIKLLVKHNRGKSVEDLPLVVSAEKKRTPPPPPPVPPRKIPRKSSLTLSKGDDNNEPPIPPVRQSQIDQINNKNRRIIPSSDKNINPPDAEVYVDLFQQETSYCLSESDDTGSSISTVVDRFASYPTTTTSSFAGSLPSTPTATQKHLDFTHQFDDDKLDQNDNYLFTKFHKSEIAALQPPANFQDAPLSYGDEDVRIVEASIKKEYNILQIDVESNVDVKTNNSKKPPPPPPRTKHALKEKNNNDYETKNKHTENLPRLVDFVPKNSNIELLETLKLFIENEQKGACDYITTPFDTDLELNKENYEMDQNWGEDSEFYTFNWSPTQLATIGEDEEELIQDTQQQRLSSNSSAPIVIIENADDKEEIAKTMRDDFDAPDGIQHDEIDTDIAQSLPKAPESGDRTAHSSFIPSDVEVMEAPFINSRQPPDGHEFPDYQEIPKPIMSDLASANTLRTSYNIRDEPSTNNVRNMIAIFSTNKPDNLSNTETKGLSKSVMNINSITSSFNNYSPCTNDNTTDANKNLVNDTIDKMEMEMEMNAAPPKKLHARSQSLIDISDEKYKPTADRWNQLVEQRRNGLSKLKGLIIPEHSENVIQVVDLPEIKSATPELKELDFAVNFPKPNHVRNSSTSAITTSSSSSTIWNLDLSTTMPKYSPAFKRKTLQIHTIKTDDTIKPTLINDIKAPKQLNASQENDECQMVNDAPKSLESITSPTRSDCSFEYISSSPELKPVTLKYQMDIRKSSKDIGKSEDESDNDSAVSSSQSSYISKNSPPNSPNHLQTHFTSSRLLENDSCNNDALNRRLLKPQSVEAINRKNILASAKCRSGRDLKGSPLIQRKFDETDASNGISDITTNDSTKETNAINEQKTRNKVDTNNKSINNEKEMKKVANTNNKNANLPRAMYNRASSVNDLRKNFEKAVDNKVTTQQRTRSSICNSNSSNVTQPTKRNSLPILQSTPKQATIKIDVQKIIEDTLKTFDEGIQKEDLKVITLNPEIPGGSLGITLAGGVDYETKEITVHKVRNGSVAFRDGRLQKGDRILSINGKKMIGLTHDDSICALKMPVSEVVIVACAGKTIPTPLLTTSRQSSLFDLSVSCSSKDIAVSAAKQEEIVVSLVKDAAGLGFSMEGGKDSPQGDVPLLIKKLFTGGIADKSGKLKIGDQLVEINSVDVSTMARLDVWTLMKKLPNGEVKLKIRR